MMYVVWMFLLGWVMCGVFELVVAILTPRPKPDPYAEKLKQLRRNMYERNRRGV